MNPRYFLAQLLASVSHKAIKPMRWITPQLLVLLLFGLLVRVLWLFIIPISEAPDEGAHYWVIYFVRTNCCLPVLADMERNPGAAYYGTLSPFAYLPHLLTSMLVMTGDIVLAARFGSVAMGLLTIFAAYHIGEIVFPTSKVFSLSLPLIVGFHPQLVFINSYTNNDSTTAALAAVGIWLSLLNIKHGVSTKRSIMLGIILGCLCLGKYSGFSIFPALVFSILIGSWLHGASLSTMIKRFFLIVLISLGISGWWFVRNFVIYNGDTLGLQNMLRLHDVAYREPPPLYPWPVLNNANWSYVVTRSFWGLFGNMDCLLPKVVYKAYFTFSLISLVSICLCLPLKVLRSLPRFPSEMNKENVCLWLTLFIAIFFNFIGLIAASASFNATGEPQGRYLFPAEIPLQAFLLGGFALLGKYAKNITAILFVVFNAAICMFSWVMLWQRYGFSVMPLR